MSDHEARIARLVRENREALEILEGCGGSAMSDELFDMRPPDMRPPRRNLFQQLTDERAEVARLRGVLGAIATFDPPGAGTNVALLVVRHEAEKALSEKAASHE